MSSEPPSKKQKTGESVETFPGFATTVIHAGQDPDQWASKSVVPLISLSTTYKQDEPAKPVRIWLLTNKEFLCPYVILEYVIHTENLHVKYSPYWKNLNV